MGLGDENVVPEDEAKTVSNKLPTRIVTVFFKLDLRTLMKITLVPSYRRHVGEVMIGDRHGAELGGIARRNHVGSASRAHLTSHISISVICCKL